MGKLRQWQGRLLRDALALERAYHALNTGSDDPEALHTLRVAIRGLRARLAPFAGNVAVDQIRSELGALAHDTNALRDDEVMRELLATLPGGPALLMRLPASPATHSLAETLALHRTGVDGLHRRVRNAVTAFTRSTVADAGRRRTRKARRKLQASLAALTPSHPAIEWHAARLRVKKARYLHEGQALWLGRRWRDFGSHCKPAQEALGRMHDLDVLWLRYGASFTPELRDAWQAARQQAMISADAAVWRLLRALGK
ncbi:CHAD domain-containing protein [Jeongeupia sp. USM3]|uniref:CHAD domain-containing protein n=1 Tax=Jeongeupia sp. USM3 TaxID=1906741 RepID=UPI00089DFB4A|nr:CHAD domain-containing protein [Jeongeupia sp. USM3]AOX99636.1 hypothetical protein BJP62_03695 [Jeongeupia sp. USM3]